MKIEIRNYKTIKHLCFEFTGFASIVGQNFIGKSAIAGALAACLQNSIDKTAIRDGESFCEVLFEREGLSVFWHYEESNTYYLINGSLFEKLDGALPPPLLEAGYSPVSAGGEKEYLWYIEQFKPLFVVHKDKSNFSTDLLASIFKFDSVYKALDLCRKEIKSTKALEKLRSEDLKQARSEMVQVQRIEDLLPAISQVESLAATVRTLGASVSSMQSFTQRLSVSRSEASRLRGVPAIPDVSANGIAEGISEVASAASKLSLMKSAAISVRALKPVSSIQDLSLEMSAAGDALRGLSSAKITAGQYHKVESFIGLAKQALGSSGIDPVQPSAIQEGLARLVAGRALLASTRKARKAAVSIDEALKRSADNTASESVSAIKAAIAGLPDARRLLAEMRSAEALVAQATKELSSAEEKSSQLFESLREFKACPLCNQPYDADKDCKHA